MLDALEALMPPGCTWTRPDGGFYVWLTLPDGLDAKVMQPRGIHERVAYVPGIGFYADGAGAENAPRPTASRRRSGSGRGCADWPA